MTATEGYSALIHSQTSKPLTSGSRTSSTTSSTPPALMRSIASAPVCASVTWKPARVSQLTSTYRFVGLSSTTSTEPGASSTITLRRPAGSR